MNKEAQENLDRLNQAAEDIKKKFLNLDEQIDKFKDMISPWFVAPELVSKPMVIGLWGTTGTGKTCMIKEFIHQLGLSQMMLDITCSSKGGYGEIGRRMLPITKTNGGRAVVILDEFQNVCTKGSFGSRNTNSTNDLWRILSNGKIEYKIEKATLIEEINSIRRRIAKRDITWDEPAFPTTWEAYRSIELVSFPEYKSVEEVMTNVTYKMWYEALVDLAKHISEKYFEYDYTKVLFIIAGNMDSAFKDATGVSSVDVDADAVYESNKTVTIFDIKRGLSLHLFPEDISRLGNNHIIFYGFAKRDYQKLIVDAIKKIAVNTERISGKVLKFDPSVYEMIYRNGVFPTQGARPVFSTIQGLIEANIPKIVFSVTTADKEINISYDDEKYNLVVNDTITIPCLGSVDEAMVRMDKDKDEKRCTSVHEIGHAIVYAELFGAIPSTMVSVVADSAVAAGFISTHLIRHTRVTMENFICTALAGMVAEEVVFGKDFRTVGCCSDLATATALAAKFVRSYAFTDAVKAVVGISTNEYNNMAGTSEVINEMVKHCAEKTKTIIQDNIEILKELSDVMFKNCKCTPQEFKEITDKHGKNYKILSFNAKITPNFQERYKLFCEAEVRNIEQIAHESAFISFFPDATVACESVTDTFSTSNLFTNSEKEAEEMTVAQENAKMMETDENGLFDLFK